MLVALIAALISSQTTPDFVARVRAQDSVAIHRAARSAQAEFERRRLALLPVEYARHDGCDVRVGRFCYWVNKEEKPPPEPPKVGSLRAKLITSLDRAAAKIPGDGWIAGQRVRYLVEAARHTDALAAARECRAAASWCASLAAFAMTSTGNVGAADSAVLAAVGAMSAEERCAVADLQLVVDEPLRTRFRSGDCDQRERLAARWFELAAPFYGRAGNPVRVEMFARRVMARIAADSRTPFSPLIGKDLEELVIRYGWPVGWARSPQKTGSWDMYDSAIGYDPPSSFALAPSSAAVESDGAIDDRAWRFDARAARVRFAIPGITALGHLARRIAVFRRGDSTLVVAAFDAAQDTALRPARAPQPELVLVAPGDPEPIVVRGDTARNGVLVAMAPWRPRLVAIQVYDSATTRGARSRDGIVADDTTGGGIGLSSLLLFAGDTLPPARLDSVFARAIAGRIAQDGRLGLFWEMYGVPEGQRVTASIGLVPEPSGGLRRLGEVIGVVEPRTPVRLSWEDAPSIDGSVGGRALLLGLDGIPPGRYRVELSIAVEGAPARRTASAVEIVSR